MRETKQEIQPCGSWCERGARLFCFCVWAVAAYVGFKYLLPIIAPFIMAFAVSAVVWRVARGMSRALRLPYALCAALVMTALMIGVGMGIFYICRQLLWEIRSVLSALSVGGIDDLERIFLLMKRIPVLSDFGEEAQEVKGSIYQIIRQCLSRAGSVISDFLGRAIRSTPTFFIGSIVTVVSCYYMSIGFDSICAFLGGLLPRWTARRAGELKSGFFDALGGYAKAYSMIFALTFFQTLMGLLILCPSRAWLGALIVAAVDVLPVFGAGFILIPWGVVSLALGEHFLGVGLLVLYVIMTVVRQIVEPKIIGESLGSHPLGTMICMFVGYRLFGVMGMLLCPVFLSVILKSLKNVQ